MCERKTDPRLKAVPRAHILGLFAIRAERVKYQNSTSREPESRSGFPTASRETLPDEVGLEDSIRGVESASERLKSPDLCTR